MTLLGMNCGVRRSSRTPGTCLALSASERGVLSTCQGSLKDFAPSPSESAETRSYQWRSVRLFPQTSSPATQPTAAPASRVRPIMRRANSGLVANSVPSGSGHPDRQDQQLVTGCRSSSERRS